MAVNTFHREIETRDVALGQTIGRPPAQTGAPQVVELPLLDLGLLRDLVEIAVEAAHRAAATVQTPPFYFARAKVLAATCQIGRLSAFP